MGVWGWGWGEEDKSGRPISVKVEIEGISIWMELDTGAAVTLLPFPECQAKFKHMHTPDRGQEPNGLEASMFTAGIGGGSKS